MDLEEAAAYYGMNPDELLRSRARGLEPGKLGYRDATKNLVWDRPEISPEKEEEMAGMIQTIAENQAASENTCDICGFVAKTPGGLASHKRTHDEEG